MCIMYARVLKLDKTIFNRYALQMKTHLALRGMSKLSTNQTLSGMRMSLIGQVADYQ